MGDAPSQPGSAVSSALCVSSEAVDRFGKVLRHLVVGLVDQAISLRLLSSDQRVESLRLGPTQTLVHQPMTWPLWRRRVTQLLDVLSHQPPKIIHAASYESYALAAELAGKLEADLVLQVASHADFRAIAELDRTQVGSYVVTSQWLQQTLVEQLRIPQARISLIHPGISASPAITCFSHPGRVDTILCTSAFERHSGVDLLVDALALLRRRGQTPMVFLLGQGRHETALRKMVRERDLAATVAFANPAGDVGAVMRSADIFVRPSADQGFVVEPLQAMATGSLLITFAAEVMDFARDGETAMVARSQTADGLADVMLQALTHKDEARRIAQAGLEHIRVHHGVSVMAERTASVYRQLVLSGSTFSIDRA